MTAQADVRADMARLVGDRIRFARKFQGLTQADLRDRLAALGWRIDGPALSRVETGARDLRLSQLGYICAALGIRPSSLLAAAEAGEWERGAS